MGLISLDVLRRAARPRGGAWASVNGIGQAIGPTHGWFRRRRLGLAVGVRSARAGGAGRVCRHPAPRSRYPGTRMPFDLVGAAALTRGPALLILGLALVSQPDLTVGCRSAWWPWRRWRWPGSSGIASRARNPFVDVRLVAESRFARSCLAAFAQMFCLGAILFAIPLYLIGKSRAISVAGLILFTVPALMAVLGPLVGHWLDRLRPRRVLRIGLVILLIAQIALGVPWRRTSCVWLCSSRSYRRSGSAPLWCRHPRPPVPPARRPESRAPAWDCSTCSVRRLGGRCGVGRGRAGCLELSDRVRGLGRHRGARAGGLVRRAAIRCRPPEVSGSWLSRSTAACISSSRSSRIASQTVNWFSGTRMSIPRLREIRSSLDSMVLRCTLSTRAVALTFPPSAR